MKLRIPGPTPVPASVLAQMSRPMINHRGPEFAALIAEITEALKRCYRTRSDVLTLTASGTGALEAGVVNFLSPGDRVLGITIGFFGDRIADIAESYGAIVHRLAAEPGNAIDPNAVRDALRRAPDTRAVLVTHNESSTGVTNPLAEIARMVRETDALVIVDAVSSLAGIDVRTDEWGLDVVATASQKAWAAPPGLAMVSVSERAWAAQRIARMPRYYWDLAAAKSWLTRGQTQATPAISIYFALAEALHVLEQEGLDQAIARHTRLGQRARAGACSLGLELLADPSVASNTVTAIRVPVGIDGNAIVSGVRDRFGIELAGGQGSLAGKVFRVGHLGWVTDGDIDEALSAIRDVLAGLGHRLPTTARN
ncbi:MAG: alanine--glyoxylate aminotransferase family protein [Chloroflexi bacterium]|nr:alanine--glyoxylate aminotransferase family protein [Chloroflexota bacterium]